MAVNTRIDRGGRISLCTAIPARAIQIRLAGTSIVPQKKASSVSNGRLNMHALWTRKVNPKQETATQEKVQALLDCWETSFCCECLVCSSYMLSKSVHELTRDLDAHSMLLLLVVYIAAGAYHQYSRYGSRGWDLIPNRAFWVGISAFRTIGHLLTMVVNAVRSSIRSSRSLPEYWSRIFGILSSIRSKARPFIDKSTQAPVKPNRGLKLLRSL